MQHVQHVLLVLLFGSLFALAQTTPNVIWLVMDDNDYLLGGASPLTETQKVVQNRGINFTNFVAHSPICCASRSSFLSGRYIHNIAATKGQCERYFNGTSGTKCCMFMLLDLAWEEKTMAVELSRAGYDTALIGKYMNNRKDWCDDNIRVPAGWSLFNAMCRNLEYDNPTFNLNGTEMKQFQGYQTAILGNMTIDFIKSRRKNAKPFFLHLSPHAPHFPSSEFDTVVSAGKKAQLLIFFFFFSSGSLV